MSYYSKNYNDNLGCLGSIICLVISIIILLAVMIGINSCSSEEWNDGECPACHENYELRGVSKDLKYYSCPECGNEVERFGGR